MNNKGFTLVELLAVIAIISILTGSAVTAVTHTITTQRKKAYKNFENNLKTAATNYISDRTDLVVPYQEDANYINPGVITLPDSAARGWTIIDAEELHDMKLLDNLIDPTDSSKECYYKKSYVKVKSEYANGDPNNPSYNVSYTYKVCLRCPGFTSKDCEN